MINVNVGQQNRNGGASEALLILGQVTSYAAGEVINEMVPSAARLPYLKRASLKAAIVTIPVVLAVYAAEYLAEKRGVKMGNQRR